ncbi:unnamed protein product [Eruca vesicaria subsp. sativa]|uniref:Uncharacterized protein n=1 Tax=Eruca vesicaria subsp. sativa TaxID=29727 RepID=A0ABC8IZE7_ERUVS|nr:unnamed protein product [Eruca vesicaria subsp. sativa]
MISELSSFVTGWDLSVILWYVSQPDGRILSGECSFYNDVCASCGWGIGMVPSLHRLCYPILRPLFFVPQVNSLSKCFSSFCFGDKYQVDMAVSDAFDSALFGAFDAEMNKLTNVPAAGVPQAMVELLGFMP